MNCRLNGDISGTCSANMGISDGIYIFPKDSVDGLIFYGDVRPDTSLFIDTISTDEPFFHIDASNITLSQTVDNKLFVHEITATFSTVNSDVEEKLRDAINGRYLVAFRLIGDSYHMLAGWKEGLTITHSLNIEENSVYSITFEGKTSFPIMGLDSSNFDLTHKVFEGHFEPLFDSSVSCSSGYATASYAVYVNSAGQALDSDGRLCSISGNKQDAYKLNGTSDGNYHIVGTYNTGATFNGKSVRKYDLNLCPVQGTITVSPTAVTLTGDGSYSSMTVNSNGSWTIESYPSSILISPITGGTGSTVVNAYGMNQCQTGYITFKNSLDGSVARCYVENKYIGVNSTYTYPNGTRTVTITPNTCGNYNVTSDVGTVTKNLDNSFTISSIPMQVASQTIHVRISLGNIYKDITITILGSNTAPSLRKISEYCEVSSD